VLLLPKEPLDEKNILLEIRPARAGTRPRFRRGPVSDVLSVRRADALEVEIKTQANRRRRFKEVIANISGDKVYSRSRTSPARTGAAGPGVPNPGRIHTSAVTVRLMPEAEEVDVAIDPNDLRIDVYLPPSGPGARA
jgi:peptide chain release factor 1